MTPWKDVPEIEPLPDTTWRRIERSVFTELSRNPGGEQAAPEPHWLSRWRRPLAGMGVALAAAAALLLALRGDPEGVPQPSRIVTHDAPVALTVGRATVRVAPESALWVQSHHGHEVMMILEQGRVECAVVHDKNRPPLVLQAGDVRVEVVGTSFAVTRQGASATVEVDEGVVEVFHRGRLERVGAGQRWTPAGLGPALAGARAAATESDGAQAIGTESDGAQAVETESDGAQPGEAAVANGQALGGAGIAVTREAAGNPARNEEGDAAGNERREVAGNERREAAGHERREVAGHERREVAGNERREAARQATSQATPQVMIDPKQRYEQAARLEASAPAEAIAIYRELARGKSAWAANALFAQARLELDRGRKAEAVRLLETYLDRYPGGNNAADARALLQTTGRPTSGR